MAGDEVPIELRPRVVLRNGVLIEFPEDHEREVADLEQALGLGDDQVGERRRELPEWVVVGPRCVVRTSEIVAFVWSGDISVYSPRS